MSFHDGPDVMQPEAEALDVVPVPCGDAVEPVEDALEVLRRDADAPVRHRDAPTGAASFQALQLDFDVRRAVTGIADGVVDEVAQDTVEVGEVPSGHLDGVPREPHSDCR